MSLLKAKLELHLIVFIWGYTAILGKLIQVEALGIVWYRMLIAFIALATWVYLSKSYQKISIKQLLRIVLVGIILAVHWLTFFWSIKVANVSVALACLSTTTLFIAIIEPLVLKRAFRAYEIAIGLLIAVALYIIFQFESNFRLGIILSLLSAFCAASFSVYNAKFVKQTNASMISSIEMLSGFLFVSFYLFISSFFIEYQWDTIFSLSSSDIIYLLILGILCTAYAFLGSVRLMKIISPYTVAVVTNLEPVYGIIMAWFIFQENKEMTSGFYIGAALIFLAIYSNSLLKAKYRKANELA